MSTEEFHRKLTAILSADVQGYSRLMGEDEESTVRTLTAYRTLMSSLIRDHRGQVVDSPGDNLLARFDSGTDAVRCAVEIQEELRIRNADLPEDRKMLFRIGVNLGDVIEEGDRIYGDGINVAARIEGLAEGGGICISGIVYDAIRNKLSLSYEFMGEHSVKNIKDPVRVYRIRMEPDAAAPKVKEKMSKVRTWQRVAFPVVVIFILGAVMVWYFSFRQGPVVSDLEEAPKTIAVLPFADLSPEKDQEYFVDGLSEELLNTLAQIPDLSVTSRTSSFYFKGTNKKLKEIANDLGVDHILEGSVRKAGNALRITAQLIRVKDDSHLWSETYDRNLEDIFAIQEDIAKTVADELKIKLGIGESFIQLGGTDNAKAYELYLTARGLFPQAKLGDSETLKVAMKSLDSAISLDPEFALAWSFKAFINFALLNYLPADSIIEGQESVVKAAQKAIEIEPNLASGYYSLGVAHTMKGEWIEAELAYRKAINLTTDPSLTNSAFSLHYFAVAHFKRANEILETTRQNDPLNQRERSAYIESLAFLGDMDRANEENEFFKSLFGHEVNLINFQRVPLEASDLVSSDPLLMNYLKENGLFYIDEADRESFETPEMVLEELRRCCYEDDSSSDGCPCQMLWFYAAYLGDPELTLASLKEFVSWQATNIYAVWFPLMHEARQLPRFKEFIREIGLVDYWNEFDWPDLCHPTDNGDFVCD